MTSDPVPRLSVIIPTRRLDDALAHRIVAYRKELTASEFIVVEPEAQGARSDVGQHNGWPSGDGGSARGLRLLTAKLGRGTQCNEGARSARGRLLLFLHDDTELPHDALPVIERAFDDPAVGAACFRLRFDHPSRVLGLYAFFSRFDSLFTTFGDQGILIRRSLFDELGGFPEWPLFEDVDLCRRIRRRSRIVKLPRTVITSAVRFERNGIVRQQIKNTSLLVRFLLGASPDKLALVYERRRSET